MTFASWTRLRSQLSFGKQEAPHLRLGRWGEKVAERNLKKQGLHILGRRVRVGKHDEIDLLAREGAILVVIEVKTRAKEGLRPVRDSVDVEKQIRLNRAGLAYARTCTPRPEGIRFDIVEVIGTPDSASAHVRHIPGAFGLHHGFRY